MSTNIKDTLPSHWTYISEGGSSIVFSYTGPPNPQFDGTALRLRKIATDAPSKPSGSEGPDEPDDPTVVFQHKIIQQLILSEYLPRLEPIQVHKQWLEELARLCEERRPAERRAKDKIDLNRRKAVLATDLVGGKGWAVEIKPKWGFLPAPTHLSPATRAVKTRSCRFCMHAHLKSCEGVDVSLGYCPLDLYSGQEHLVTKALHALWDAWIGSSGAVNNFRVFVDGTMLRPSTLPSSLSPLAHQVFASTLTDHDVDLTSLRDALVSTLLPLLLHTPVLHTLSTHQRALDALDIEGLSSLWARTHANVDTALGADLPPPTIDELERFVQTYKAKHGAMDHAHPDSADLRYYCMAYLLSATFKDCSIILRMPGEGKKGTISVIDLDVKDMDRLAKWEKLDRAIVGEYVKISEPAQCIDRWAAI